MENKGFRSDMVPDIRNDYPLAPKGDNSATRGWGGWLVIDQEARYKVKRLVVKPAAKLSMQRHMHRDEAWVVVAGTIELHTYTNEGTPDDELETFHEGEAFVIRAGVWHQVSNPGKIHAVAIEVQTGSYLGEDDIERDLGFDDGEHDA